MISACQASKRKVLIVSAVPFHTHYSDTKSHSAFYTSRISATECRRGRSSGRLFAHTVIEPRSLHVYPHTRHSTPRKATWSPDPSSTSLFRHRLVSLTSQVFIRQRNRSIVRVAHNSSHTLPYYTPAYQSPAKPKQRRPSETQFRPQNWQETRGEAFLDKEVYSTACLVAPAHHHLQNQQSTIPVESLSKEDNLPITAVHPQTPILAPVQQILVAQCQVLQTMESRRRDREEAVVFPRLATCLQALAMHLVVVHLRDLHPQKNSPLRCNV